MKNYEMLYKESLDKLQEVVNNAKKQGHIIVRVEDLENTFHELKETEDERISNAISYAIGNSIHEDGTLIYGVTESEAMAWLEKHMPTTNIQNLTWEDIEKIGEFINTVQNENPNGIGAECLYTDVLERFLDGKQTKQKPINDTDEDIVEVVKDTSILDFMVEPKFNVGDWVVDSQGLTHQIERVVENVTTHTFGYDIVGGGYFNDDNEGVHLWTIQDAKDGDVLQLGWVTAIFKEYIGNGTCGCYCSVCKGEFEIPADDGFDNVYGCYDTHPATQEQRDLLFQKMKEAGYEWNAEKKELKIIDWSKHIKYEPNSPSIIEQNPAWSEEDEEMFDAIIADIQFTQKAHNNEINQIVFEREIEWLKSLKERFNLQPKQEWSEEDKGNLLDVKCIIDKVWHSKDFREDTYYSSEELESLWSWLDDIWQKVEYPSSTWKPSEEQIQALEYQVHSTYEGSWQYKASKALLEQLKKL